MIKRGVDAFWLFDVAGDRLVFNSGGDAVVSKDPDARTPTIYTDGILSPSGTRIASEKSDSSGEINLLYDAETGRLLGTTRSDEGHKVVILTQWIDDESFVAVGSMDTGNDGPVDILTCTVTSPTCKVVVRDVAPHNRSDPYDAVQFPIGFPL